MRESQGENAEAFETVLRDAGLIVYPTDTVYGVGCDATNEDAVQRLRDAKRRPQKPVSVIAPTKQWIHEHCDVNDEAKTQVDRLPGPYTFILSVQDDALASNVAPENTTVGVRRPDHWITGAVQQTGKPVVTTSANISGEPTAEHPDDLPDAFTSHVDLVIEDGRLTGSPSTIIDLTESEPRRVR